VFIRMNRKKPATRIANCGRSFLKDSEGQVAIEMAMVSVPFLTMMFGIINAGMFFYAINCIDRGLEDAARFIRTGEAQKGTVPGASGQMTAGSFRTMVCDKATSYIDCSKLQIRIFSAADWSGVNPFTCPTAGALDGGAIAAGDGTPISTMAGTQSAVVLITACYQWSMGKYLPFIHIDKKFSDGSSLIQSSTALKIEPYI
jgi:Flp pilus assembly protein TadG